MARPRGKSGPARVGAKWLAERLFDDQMREARCKQYPQLPWTADVEPSYRVKLLMQECCSGCPVPKRCAEMGLNAQGGMYAGVWLPWKGDRGSAGVRTARVALRARLRALSRESVSA